MSWVQEEEGEEEEEEEEEAQSREEEKVRWETARTGRHGHYRLECCGFVGG